jgi:DNA-binding NtrC family response regulator
MKKKPTVLIVDDEKNTREGLARALQGAHRVLLAESGAAALRLLEEEPVDVVLSDLRMPEMDGLTLMQRALARTPQPAVILLTAYGSIESAVEAMRLGAYDFLTKPVNLDRLDLLLKRALASREMETENRRLREQLTTRFGLENLVGQSAAMQQTIEMIRQVAPSRSTVLIQGESGTGKELVAQAIHNLSPRSKGPFVAVHGASLTPTLLESELFGHEKGAFTGAVENRRGRFELADGGTLFLDEIGEIDARLQVKILRVLEEHRFERVGGQRTIDVDVRLITATNRDLRERVARGEFREDLFYRLNVVVLHIPPLRERMEDIPLLASHFLKEFAAENQKPVPALSPDALDALAAHGWPGNVRELRNVIERMVVMARGDRLTLRDVPPAVREGAGRPRGRGGPAGGAGLTLDDMERRMIVQALDAHGGHRVKAARQLGISRRTLHRKLNEYGLRETDGDAGRA